MVTSVLEGLLEAVTVALGVERAPGAEPPADGEAATVGDVWDADALLVVPVEPLADGGAAPVGDAEVADGPLVAPGEGASPR